MFDRILRNIYEKTFSGKERVLHFMALAPKEYSIKEIADSTGQSAANVRRIVKALADDGLVNSPGRGRWVLVKDLKSVHKLIGQIIE